MKNDQIDTVNIIFENENIGRKWMRRKFPNRANNIPFTVSIQRILKSFKMVRNVSSSMVTRKQFPLRPNTAITIHRSQGRTIQRGVVDLSRANLSGMHSVALSRFRNLSKKIIINLNERRISVDQKVVVEMERLRTTRQLVLQCQPINELPKPKLRTMYQNERSIRKNHWSVLAGSESTHVDSSK